MAKIHGRLSNFLWNSTAVNGIETVSDSLQRPKIDCTSHDTGDAREYIVGRQEGTISLTLRYDAADTGQAALMTDFAAGTQRAMEFRMETAGGALKWTGNGDIESMSKTGPNDDVADMSVEIYFNGAITKGTQ